MPGCVVPRPEQTVLHKTTDLAQPLFKLRIVFQLAQRSEPSYLGANGPVEESLRQEPPLAHRIGVESFARPILTNQQQQMMQLHQDQSLSREDKMAKGKSLHEDTTSKIEAVLTPDQKQKYEAMQQKMQERMQERMQGGAGTPPPAQPQ